jgi:hypothetical protein
MHLTVILSFILRISKAFNQRIFFTIKLMILSNYNSLKKNTINNHHPLMIWNQKNVLKSDHYFNLKYMFKNCFNYNV